MIKVNEIMTTHVVTVSSSDSLSKTRKLMSENKIRHIPVVNEHQNIVGLVTQRDLLKASCSSIEAHQMKANTIFNADESDIPITKIMTENVMTTYPQASLRIVGLAMQKHKYGCIPVISEEKLVGIITDTDFVGVAINLIEQVEQHEEIDYEAEY